jgi:uridine kinase
MRLAQTLAEHICANLDKQSSPFLVAICGWADTGKSTLAKDLSAALATLGVDADWISTDAFMKDRAERNALGITGYNHLSIDSTLLASTIDHFVGGEAFAYRPYDNRSRVGRDSCKKPQEWP